MLGEPENQFSLTRAALNAFGRGKNNFLSVSVFFWCWPGLLFGLLLFFSVDGVCAVENQKPTNQLSKAAAPKSLMAALPPAKWQAVEKSVDHALAWIASQQAADGSFPTLPAGQPAVTSLCVLGFLSRGDQPGTGPYGPQLDRAIDFVLSCQMSNGVFSYAPLGTTHVHNSPVHTAIYNHAIAGLMLGELFGQVTGERARRVKPAIESALKFERDLQTRDKAHAFDKGGWRYLLLRSTDIDVADSDMSVTAWMLMFLRSARNAEFNVPQTWIDEAMVYVRECWKEKEGVFYYALTGPGDVRTGRAMVAAGALSLSLAGQHQTPTALAAGNWLLAHPFTRYGEVVGGYDRFFYGAYYCSQAAAQLGGRYWEGIYPPLVNALLNSQSPDGSWPVEIGHGDSAFGNVYTTAMAVLSLTPPYQLLPVYQR